MPRSKNDSGLYEPKGTFHFNVKYKGGRSHFQPGTSRVAIRISNGFGSLKLVGGRPPMKSASFAAANGKALSMRRKRPDPKSFDLTYPCAGSETVFGVSR